MSGYRRLISYIYEYEGEEKGKNVGFVKLEAKNGQCRMNINVKNIYVGGNPIGVYLLGKQGQRSFLGNMFVRGGVGEFRAVLDSENVEGSGNDLDTYYGLTVHDIKNPWRAYTTVWEDVPGELDGTEDRKEDRKPEEKTDVERGPIALEILPGGLGNVPIPVTGSIAEEIEAALAMEEERNGVRTAEIVDDVEPICDEMPVCPASESDDPSEEIRPDIESVRAAESVRSDTGAFRTAESVRSDTGAFCSAESVRSETGIARQTEPAAASESVQSPELENPELLQYLQDSEGSAADPEQLWEELRKSYPKIQPFAYGEGSEVLTVRPQDIGRLPRENWVYGNNSFLLHGYYNFRYLILARLENPNGKPRYLLGVPGHYYSNEKYMATMFGFPHFVLSKKQPPNDGRFGYWYTDIKMR